MRGEVIGIISEGAEDQGVLKSILKSFNFDGSEIRLIRPALALDATDKHNQQQTIGTIQGVKNSCIGNEGERPDFDNAFSILNCQNIVIQIDTAEIDNQDFSFVKPTKKDNENYCSELRNLAIDLINNWLNGNYQNNILYAITIEEIEAWCLTIFEKAETSNAANSKTKLASCLSRKNLTYKDLSFDSKKQKQAYFEEITKEFRKKKNLLKYAEYNGSLKAFVESLEERFPENE